MKDIIIKGARQHNLKNIDVTIPRNSFTVITGLSGSGKSTLAFDTLYAEGQRRYVESLSAYARQFLGLMQKPDVDSIEGLSPAISIEQKTTSNNPRSTVGTVTEIYDYLRLLFARIGIPHCPKCGDPVHPQSADVITDQIMLNKGKKVQILAPVVRQKKGTYQQLLADYHKDGFLRARLNGQIINTDQTIELDRYKKHDIEVVVDRIAIDERYRVQDAVETALNLAKGFVIALYEDGEQMYSQHAACVRCTIFLDELEPRHFSFNSPFGACSICEGIGMQQTIDRDLLIPDANKSIFDGAIACWKGPFAGWRIHQVAKLGKEMGFSVRTPVNKMEKEHLDAVLYGGGSYEGIVPTMERLYRTANSDERRADMQRYMNFLPCPGCRGKRLKKEALSVYVGGKNIIDVTDLSIGECAKFFDGLKLSDTDLHIAVQVLKEIKQRLSFLNNVGLSYLTLSRSAGTLCGGEAQRIRLATQIGSALTGVMYILDEPSIGLHQRDNDKLIATLKHLRDLGNTVIVVEHDNDTIMAADHLIDIGPGSGIHGGHIVAIGTPQDVMRNPKSLTGEYLAGKRYITVPTTRRKGRGNITIEGANENNLKDVSVDIPTGVLTVVTGVSGSGKSTLINQTLARRLGRELNDSKEIPGKHKRILYDVDKLVLVDQSPIGRTPRSNPATYTKVFDEIRLLFAQTKEAKARAYKEGRFSFNVRGGRCEHCEGEGQILIEMNFLPDVHVPCEHCKGARYNKETLEITFKGKNISQVLNMKVDEAVEFFSAVPQIARKLQTLADVGLGYISLGQSSTTLSGGESQRIKLTRELAKTGTGNALYILDEPTTGLHFEDIRKLLIVLNRLVDKGNTIVVIEHNLDVIKCADHLIDLGPEGGSGGGEILFTGTPEQLIKQTRSHTAKYLKPLLR